MPASTVRVRKQRILQSVFGGDVFSQPTPLVASTAPGQPFGGPLANTDLSPSVQHHTAATDQVRWDRAWHAVTSRIQLPSSVTVEDSFGALASESQQDAGDASFHDSLALVLDPATLAPCAAHTEDILLWHAQQVRQHFVQHVLPLLAACSSQGGDHSQVLLSSVRTLEAAHRQYVYGLALIARGIKDETAKNVALERFTRDLHALIGNSWTRGLTEALGHALSRLLAAILGSNRHSTAPSDDVDDVTQQTLVARRELFSLLESLTSVGLAGDRFQVLFGESMDACMKDFIQHRYARVWTSLDPNGNIDPSASYGCISHLCDWVENHYGRLAVEVLRCLSGQVACVDVEKWREVAIGRLASLRMLELFDMVLHWPQSKGGLEDLRSTVTTPQRRLELTDVFAASLQMRLLHPGRSTLNILQSYIAMIRTFHQLDASKVLLDRVAQSLQLYLCQRNDAIRIVVTGLLANPASGTAENDEKRLNELAVLLNDTSQQHRGHVDDEDLDWDDMAWVPDPVDAGPNYKRPKSEDVVGTLINALGSQEIFIKEFQAIIAERLLSNQANYQQEIKVLSLLKKRYGENALQNCDVMVKDIYDSKRVDTQLRKNMRGSRQSHSKVDADRPPLTYHSKILSRLFWPSILPEPFKIPAPVARVRAQYEGGFEKLKTCRKLTWLDQVGTATVQLDLQDRSLEIQCKTYEAAVIYAFQDSRSDDHDDDAGGARAPQQRTFNELWEQLTMDEDLLKSALEFWLSQGVLGHVDGDQQTFVVLERRGNELQQQQNLANAASSAMAPSSTTDSAQPPMLSSPSPLPSMSSLPRKAKLNAKEQETRTVYWQFIVGMLTNSSPAMPLTQIAMMMKMLLTDGCTWSEDELREFLAEKVAGQDLELSGGRYRLVKK